MKLSLNTLSSLPQTVARPTYDRKSLSPGILHVGLGNFHRAHQAVYLDQLFNAGRDHDWAVLGAGVRPGDARLRELLGAQDWLSTVVEMEPGGYRPHVTGAMMDFVAVDPGNGPLVRAMSDPAIRIVSLTVTEGGYYINPASGHFDPDHSEMRADAANPGAPASVFGAIIAALKARRTAGVAPFTVMSCDNLPHNGVVTKNAVLGLAERIDPALASWMAAEVAFPNGMVDRITPATTDRERNFLKETYGLEDSHPVFCEPFRQWVLEDMFPQGRPALEEAGVTFTDRVEAYETMKIRILNGGHAVIAYPSALLDLEYAHDAMAHPLVRGFLDRVESEEIIPTVPPVPDTDLDAYYRLVAERFSNPEVGDRIARLCLDGSNRQPKFILPTLRDRLSQGRSIRGLALESALWCRYCYGESESGREIPPNDENWPHLKKHARAARQNPLAFLEMRETYGELADDQDFRNAFAAALVSLWEKGTAATLSEYLERAAA